jgi:hypothetical protein
MLWVLTFHGVALAGLHALAPRQARGNDRPELEEGVQQSLGGGGPLVGVPVAERLQEQNSTGDSSAVLQADFNWILSLVTHQQRLDPEVERLQEKQSRESLF